jgi:hypothetical protein
MYIDLKTVVSSIKEAQSDWTGLDWSTDEEPSEDFLKEVESDASEASDLGDEALKYICLFEETKDPAHLDKALIALQEARHIEWEYGDSPTWDVPFRNLVRFIAEEEIR